MHILYNWFSTCILLLTITIWTTNAEPKATVQELISGWTLQNQNKTIKITGLRLPSGVYSALSNTYGDILQSENDNTLRWIAYDNWTYAAEFDVLDLKLTQRINLTLHGIDTVSTIRLNGKIIGRTANMFERYSIQINNAVKENNILEIEITSPIWAAKHNAERSHESYPPKCTPPHVNGVCHGNLLRKMQSSFGSDATLAALSMGIWKYVTLEFYDTALMRDIDIAVRKNDTHWNMDIRVFIDSNHKDNFYGNFTFMAPDLLDKPIVFPTRLINCVSLVLDYKVQIPKNKVIEWWPHGYGEQKLYPLIFSMKCFENMNSRFRSGWLSEKVINFGFRTLELVEDKDDFGRTFYFQVNGRPIFIKGAIYLPSHILPEEESHLTISGQERIQHLLQSAKEANLNMIRIWGGGTYGSDFLYNLADTLGIFIWQDFPFTRATYPMFFIDSVICEITQNAKRITYHPSLAIMAFNNEIELYLVKNRTDFGKDADRLENDYKQLFIGIIQHELKIISRKEYNRGPGSLLTTPSLGFKEKSTLPLNPQDPNYGDVHFWPEDGADVLNAGVWEPARFISEYGFQSLPVRVSWNRTIRKDDTILSLIQHRQHEVKRFKALTDLIEKHFSEFNWQEDVETFIYFSQIAQAMAVKTATEVFLSNYNEEYRTMGAIYWHLNDVWIAPTWSSIDYYGNYKILYYWSKHFLAPVNIIVFKEGKNTMKITIINDGEIIDNSKENDEVFSIIINTYLWSELFPKKTVVLEKNLHNKRFNTFSLPLNDFLTQPFNENNCFIEIILSQSGTIYAKNILFPGNSLKDAIGISDPELKLSEPKRASEQVTFNNRYVLRYSLTIQVTKPAVFIYIEIFHPEISKYKLSDNGFLLVDPLRVIFLSFEHGFRDLEQKLTKQHIKITTMNQYMVKIRDTTSTTTTTISSLSSNTQSDETIANTERNN